MDKLEEHIRKNREDLDRYNVPPDAWRRIDKEIRKEKSFMRHWLSIAAMIVVILGTALVLFKPEFRLSFPGKHKNIDEQLTQYNPQLKETEVYYNSLINTLYKEAAPLLTKNPDVKKELNSGLYQLDSICTDIKKDLKDNVANQEVVEALIQNYRIRIRLLEDMLSVLKEDDKNAYKKKSHEL
jgi:hypothetical protein